MIRLKSSKDRRRTINNTTNNNPNKIRKMKSEKWLTLSSTSAKMLLLQLLLCQMLIFKVCLGQTFTAEDPDLRDSTLITSRNGSTPLTIPSFRQPSFAPIVTATCRAGIMTIKVETLNNFAGVVHSRDYRKPKCSGYGENSRVTFLRVNLLSKKDDDDYCGVFYSQPHSEERSIAVAVRTHRTLELVDDKFYMITCGKAGFQNSKNQTSEVNLKLLKMGNKQAKKIDQVVYGREYIIRADISHPDGQFGMKVKRCFSFSDTNNTVLLVDEKGCADNDIMTDFEYNYELGYAEAKIHSMFKFPETNRVHFQCDILVCRDKCTSPVCNTGTGNSSSISSEVARPGRSLAAKGKSSEDGKPPEALFLLPSDDGALMASYSVFVVEPGSDPDVEASCSDCGGPNPPWLLYLCIVFGILFLLMLIVNIFLCSAMTCSCARADIVDKEPSSVEEFDPYTRSWGGANGSQYGSRYSLSNGIKPIPPPLISVDTSHSLSSSAASDYGVSVNGNGHLVGPASMPAQTSNSNGIGISGSSNGMPGVYGVPVHSRPSSRYSNRSHRSHRYRNRSQGPGNGTATLTYNNGGLSSSSAGSHYSKYSGGRILQ